MSEKKLLTEFLHLYREFPCLWDIRQVVYNDKEARDQAYEILLEKYKEVQEDATIIDVKKKIEHMRCAYRREHKKVLRSRLNGEEEHVPLLWYYEHLTFLNDVCNFSRLQVQTTSSDSNAFEEMKIEFEDADCPKPVRTKKRKSNNMSTVYLPEHESDDDNNIAMDNDDILISQDDCDSIQNSTRVNSGNARGVTEAEAFGTTIGLQLKDLKDPIQKTIAQKLISDVVFLARLNRLSLNASINT